MIKFLERLAQDETGATAVEYTLIGALVSVASITGFEAFGASFSSMFETVASEIKTVVAGST